MYEINARNVNDAWQHAKMLLSKYGVKRESRFGPVLEYPEPVVTRYARPWERVLFDPHRDANPFFHLFESLWMLAGRNDVAYVKQFSTQIGQFSDNGVEFHGAYGKRWRSWFEDLYTEEGKNISFSEYRPIDQLKGIIEMLKKNPDDRRAVLQMWDPPNDFNKTGKDFPCNTNIYFKIRGGPQDPRLYMTVSNRSNDIVWGCYGANAVHMSVLQEYMALMIGVAIGPYHQVSDSWHGYTATFQKFWDDSGTGCADPYCEPMSGNPMSLIPLVHAPENFDHECAMFVDEKFESDTQWQNHFFPMVAIPMLQAWRWYKEKRREDALNWATSVQADDWKYAAVDWLGRRKW